MSVPPLWSGFAGGLALFLLGLWLATDGFRVAGGSVLKTLLRSWTRNRTRAFLTGFLMALLLPSSGALTFAAIGFVNCGFVSLANALWVVVGCSFGSVVSAWLVVAVGTNPHASTLALTLVALGILLRWTGGASARASWGAVLAGVGVLCLGIDFLSGAFEGLGQGFPIDAAITVTGPARTLVFLVIGAILTLVLRTSSAAVAVVLIAAGANAVSVLPAAAATLGATLAATSTALLALASGTPDAKRVAAGHVFFHVLTFALGFVLLLVTTPFVADMMDVLLDASLALALFVTVFSTAGALVLVPLGPPLTRAMRSWIGAQEVEGFEPQSLDPCVLTIPELAMEGLLKEVQEISVVARRLARTVLLGERTTTFRLKADMGKVNSLARAVDEYVTRLCRLEVPDSVAATLLEVPRASQSYRKLCEGAAFIRNEALDEDAELDAPLRSRMRRFQLAVLHLLEGADPFRPDFSEDSIRGELEGVQVHLRDLKLRLFSYLTDRILTAEDLHRLLERVNAVRRIAQSAVDAAISLERARFPLNTNSTPLALVPSDEPSEAMPEEPPSERAAG